MSKNRSLSKAPASQPEPSHRGRHRGNTSPAKTQTVPALTKGAENRKTRTDKVSERKMSCLRTASFCYLTFCIVRNFGYSMFPVKVRGRCIVNLIGGADMRVKITLACTECKQRNYNTKKNKKNDPDRLEMNKYCKFCRKHTLHKETK